MLKKAIITQILIIENGLYFLTHTEALLIIIIVKANSSL